MKSFEYKHYGKDLVIFNNVLFKEFPLKLFNPKNFNSTTLVDENFINSIDGQNRGSVHVFNFQGNALALRHYYRGGLVSKIINDKYIWQGLNRSRAVCELYMLSRMQEMGLPVPIPVAAHIYKTGLIYSTDIITRFIPNTQSLSALLTDKIIQTSTWREIGSVIKRFHNNNCNHADLNAHNILIDEDYRIFLIDFDKSKIENNAGAWKKKNIRRLKRSFEKLKKNRDIFNYNKENFDRLLEGYNGC